jgi:hypothetical protein
MIDLNVFFEVLADVLIHPGISNKLSLMLAVAMIAGFKANGIRGLVKYLSVFTLIWGAFFVWMLVSFSNPATIQEALVPWTLMIIAFGIYTIGLAVGSTASEYCQRKANDAVPKFWEINQEG